MVPGHTKFAPDLLFSQIASRFNITDVFKSEELRQVVRSCQATPVELPPTDMRIWKDDLALKYVAIPNITSGNYFVLSSTEDSNVQLQVKRSVLDEAYAPAFRNQSTSLKILKRGQSLAHSAIPNVEKSADSLPSIGNELSRSNLQNISEMYSSFTAKDRWPTQLLAALEKEKGDETETQRSEDHLPLNSQEDSLALRVGDDIGTETAAAQAHSILRRVGGEIEQRYRL